MSIPRVQIGDTIRLTWTNSGVFPTAIHAAVYDGDEVLISSESMISSGNGHFYSPYFVTNSDPQFYVAELVSVVNSYTYLRRLRFQSVLSEVD